MARDMKMYGNKMKNGQGPRGVKGENQCSLHFTYTLDKNDEDV